MIYNNLYLTIIIYTERSTSRDIILYGVVRSDDRNAVFRQEDAGERRPRETELGVPDERRAHSGGVP